MARTVDMAFMRTRVKALVSARVDDHGGDFRRHENKEGLESLVANEKIRDLVYGVDRSTRRQEFTAIL